MMTAEPPTSGARRGDFVTAVSIALGFPVQGILMQVCDDGTVLVLGQQGMYRCHAAVTVVSDDSLWGDAHDFAMGWLAEDACGGHDWEAIGPMTLSYPEQGWRCRKCGLEEE